MIQGTRIRAVFPLVAGAGILCALAILTHYLRWLVDAALFDLKTAVFLGRLEVEWVTLSLLSSIAYALLKFVLKLISLSKLTIREHPATIWTENFLAMLATLYWIVALHFVALVRAAGDDPRLWLPLDDILETLMVSSAAAVAWAAVSPLAKSAMSLGRVFLFDLGALLVAYVALEPDSTRYILISLGLPGQQSDFLGGGNFLVTLPYLAIVPPLVLEAFHRPRKSEK
jgi:hypothetical protein